MQMQYRCIKYRYIALSFSSQQNTSRFIWCVLYSCTRHACMCIKKSTISGHELSSFREGERNGVLHILYIRYNFIENRDNSSMDREFILCESISFIFFFRIFFFYISSVDYRKKFGSNNLTWCTLLLKNYDWKIRSAIFFNFYETLIKQDSCLFSFQIQNMFNNINSDFIPRRFFVVVNRIFFRQHTQYAK